MRLLAIDPGPEQSAWVVYDTTQRVPTCWDKVDNATLLDVLTVTTCDRVTIETIASYGMAVGAEVFETCIWVGRFIERWVSSHNHNPILVFRKDVKLHLCGSARAKDSNIRQALIDRYGPGKEKAIGLKKTPGPLYGMSGDCWAALAVAVTAAETRLSGQEAA